MPAESLLARELRALQEEVSASRRDRRAPNEAQDPIRNAAGTAPRGSASTATPEPSEDELLARTQLGELADEIGRYFETAETTISAHPFESVAAALLIGILIGRLVGRH